jgi:hypothetical protein
VSVGLVFTAQRCFSAALRGAELSRCARCPPACAAPGTLLSLRAQPRPVARPMEAHQAACSSRRTLSRPARPPRSGLDLAHLVEAERGRRTLQAWQPWRTVSWCRGDKERAGSACRSGLRTPATCVSVFKLERLRDALIRLRWIPSILVAARARLVPHQGCNLFG